MGFANSRGCGDKVVSASIARRNVIAYLLLLVPFFHFTGQSVVKFPYEKLRHSPQALYPSILLSPNETIGVTLFHGEGGLWRRILYSIVMITGS